MTPHINTRLETGDQEEQASNGSLRRSLASTSASPHKEQENTCGSGEKSADEPSEDENVAGDDNEGDAHIGGKIVQPLSAEALAAFEKAQNRAGVIYISRIPPGMKPTKVRHLLSAYGEIGRVYLQQEDAKRAYLRRKHTSTKKAHYTEGWVEFVSKRIARSVAEMLNAQPIGGKKGSRFRDDIWTMKYLPRFKWNMLTEQIAHEAATHAAKLRVELDQSRSEQRDYLKNVELARVLEKRAKRKRETPGKSSGGLVEDLTPTEARKDKDPKPKKRRKDTRPVNDVGDSRERLDDVLQSVF